MHVQTVKTFRIYRRKAVHLGQVFLRRYAYHLEDKQQRSLAHQVCLQKIAVALDKRIYNTRSTVVPLSVLIIFNEKFVFLAKRLKWRTASHARIVVLLFQFFHAHV